MEKKRVSIDWFEKDYEYIKSIKEETGKTYSYIVRDLVQAHKELNK